MNQQLRGYLLFCKHWVTSLPLFDLTNPMRDQANSQAESTNQLKSFYSYSLPVAELELLPWKDLLEQDLIRHDILTNLQWIKNNNKHNISTFQIWLLNQLENNWEIKIIFKVILVDENAWFRLQDGVTKFGRQIWNQCEKYRLYHLTLVVQCDSIDLIPPTHIRP